MTHRTNAPRMGRGITGGLAAALLVCPLLLAPGPDARAQLPVQPPSLGRAPLPQPFEAHKLPLFRPTQWHIVATLDSVTIHDDEDPTGPGEVMLVAAGGSGSTVQNLGFPIRIWREAHSGSTFPVNIPLLVLPESAMGDRLALAVAAIDNDDVPTWFEDSLAETGRIAGGVVGSEIGGTSGAATGSDIGHTLGTALARYLDENELIGAFGVTHSQALDRWGTEITGPPGGDIPPPFPSRTRTVRAGGMSVTYTVARVPSDPDMLRRMRVFVRLDGIDVHENGDGANGEIFGYARATDGTRAPEVQRFPRGGTFSRPDHSTIPLGDARDPGTLIFEQKGISPFLHVEVDVWDEDSPDLGDDHDMLGIATWKLYTPNLALPTRVGERKSFSMSLRSRGIDEGDVTARIALIYQLEER